MLSAPAATSEAATQSVPEVAAVPIRRHLGSVLAGNLGVQLVGLVRGILIPLLVTPPQYGMWRLVLIVWQYGAYMHLGSFALLNRELLFF